MAENKEFVKRSIQKAVQKMLRDEAFGWPPDCSGAFYQPRRPDKPLADVTPDKTKKMEA